MGLSHDTEMPWESFALLEGILQPSSTSQGNTPIAYICYTLREGEIIASLTHCSTQSPKV